jgi:chemotaxis protein MotB
MEHRSVALSLLAGCGLLLAGCVATGTYEQKAREAQTLEESLKTLRRQQEEGQTLTASLKDQVTALTAEGGKLQQENSRLTGERDVLARERELLSTRNRELQEQLHAKPDTLTGTMAELQLKNTDIASENIKLRDTIAGLEKNVATLKGDIAALQQLKDEGVRSTSKIYEEYLEKLKVEISRGEAGVSELKGTLTVGLAEAALFGPDGAVLKKEGEALLQKVVDIMKGLPGVPVRVEAHVDSVAGGELSAPGGWDTAASRVIAVVNFLRKSGIAPELLAATTSGRYLPGSAADNGEGRNRNRRIDMVLVPGK